MQNPDQGKEKAGLPFLVMSCNHLKPLVTSQRMPRWFAAGRKNLFWKLNAAAVISAFKREEPAVAAHASWLLCALLFHFIAQSCDILPVGRFGERSPNSSNLLPVHVEPRTRRTNACFQNEAWRSHVWSVKLLSTTCPNVRISSTKWNLTAVIFFSSRSSFARNSQHRGSTRSSSAGWTGLVHPWGLLLFHFFCRLLVPSQKACWRMWISGGAPARASNDWALWH